VQESGLFLCVLYTVSSGHPVLGPPHWLPRSVSSLAYTLAHHSTNFFSFMQISFAEESHIAGWLSPSGDTHWEVVMWVNGTTEPGSSGSPLFNQVQRSVVLHASRVQSSSVAQWWDARGGCEMGQRVSGNCSSAVFSRCREWGSQRSLLCALLLFPS
jgi:lysyl endopeptidase